MFGYQFRSAQYEIEPLKTNVSSTFDQAVVRFNEENPRARISLDFKPLAAGYGEHLFNNIARNTIGSDIAVFETSDLNSNVMLEMGVALTWGVQVLPLKAEGRPRPPSDVSGQTWVDYRDSASAFVDADHDSKILHLVERAVRKKGHGPRNSPHAPSPQTTRHGDSER